MTNINVDLKEPMQMIETAFIEFGSYNLDWAINMNWKFNYDPNDNFSDLKTM